MKKFAFLSLLIAGISMGSFAQKPLTDPNGNWTLLPDYSDEFNGTVVNSAIWDYNVADWGVWSWEPENVYLSGTGTMKIRMVNEQHVRSGTTYYFKSGAARQKKEITYGYFEAKVKGCPKFPGVCPAFWTYSVNQPVTDGIKYNEIDFMEIQQRQNDIKKIDCNLHLERVINGVVVRTDPALLYVAPFNSNEGFHVYGCNVTPTLISIYIDGVLAGTHVNDYYRLPMRVTLSMGLRPPLMVYTSNGGREPLPILNEPGFPTEMEVDYVRVWQSTLPISLTSFTGKERGKSILLDWTTASEKNNKAFEILRSADGKDFKSIGTVNGAGNSEVAKSYSFSDDNPFSGINYYQLKQIDFDGKSTLSGIVTVNSKIATSKVYPSIAKDKINVEINGNNGITEVQIVNLLGQVVKAQKLQNTEGVTSINISDLSNGSYIVRLVSKSGDVSYRIEKQ